LESGQTRFPKHWKISRENFQGLEKRRVVCSEAWKNGDKKSKAWNPDALRGRDQALENGPQGPALQIA
jgi:hypothetical protein